MNDKIYIDFDGVIVNTQDRVDELFSRFNNEITPEWNRYLANINWKLEMLPYAKEINNSFEILKELYKLKKEVYVLTRVFSENEALDKEEFLKDNGIFIKLIPTFGRVAKSKIIIPNQNKILIDDSKDNVKDWIDNKGKGIYFTNNIIDLIISKYMDFNGKGYYIDKENRIFFQDSVDNLGFLLTKKR